MSIFPILAILFISTVNCVVSVKYPYIGECYYNDGNYADSNLTLVCVKENRETTLFKPYDKTICVNQAVCSADCKDGFYKFMVGRVSFKNCALPKIPSKLFKIYDNIRILNMSSLGTESLHPDNFFEASFLVTLLASHNKIVEIPANLFADAQKLTDVDLSFNRISEFHAHAFVNGNRLKFLNLSHNNISELTVETFQKLTELKQLRLDHNQITELPSFLFHKNEKLIEVDFSFNKIKKIDDFAFAGDFKLEKLNLSNNQLTKFQKRFSDNHSNLKELDLSNNQISTLKPDTFESLHDLMLLDLSSNLIKNLHHSTFGTLVKLQQLFLQQNNLTEIRIGTFSPLLSLRILDLSKNFLKTLDADVLPPQSSLLELLAITDNQLSELNGFTSLRIPNTKIVGIDSNRFNCTFLDHLFQVITWRHIGSISIRIACDSGNETTESADSSESATFSWVDESGSSDLSSSDPNLVGQGKLNSTQIVQIGRNSAEEVGRESSVANGDSIAHESSITDRSSIDRGNETNSNEKSVPLKVEVAKTMQQTAITSKHGTNQTKTEHADELALVKKYLYILICVITVGFTITTLLFIRLILHTRMLEKERQTTRTDFDVKYYVETVKSIEMPNPMNAADNHTYEVIEIAKSECSS